MLDLRLVKARSVQFFLCLPTEYGGFDCNVDRPMVAADGLSVRLLQMQQFLGASIFLPLAGGRV